MTPPDPLTLASFFLVTALSGTVGAAPAAAPPAGPPGVVLQATQAGATDPVRLLLNPEEARRLAHALLAAADYLRPAYHAWEQEQSGVQTPPLPFDYPEAQE